MNTFQPLRLVVFVLIFMSIKLVPLLGQQEVFTGTVTTKFYDPINRPSRGSTMKMLSNARDMPLANFDTITTYYTICGDTLLGSLQDVNGVVHDDFIQLDGYNYTKNSSMNYYVKIPTWNSRFNTGISGDKWKKNRNEKTVDAFSYNYSFSHSIHPKWVYYGSVDDQILYTQQSEREGDFGYIFPGIGLFDTLLCLEDNTSTVTVFEYEMNNTVTCSETVAKIHFQELSDEEVNDLFPVYQPDTILNNLASTILPLTNIIDSNGNRPFYSELASGGYPLIYLDIWATWCAPCIEEMPYLRQLRDSFPTEDLTVVSLAIEREEDILEWKNKVAEFNLTWLNWLMKKGDEIHLTKAIGLKAIPRYVLLDAKGQILLADAPRPSDDRIYPLLRDAIKARSQDE